MTPRPDALMVSPVTERLGFTDLVRRLAAEAPRRDTERLLFTDLRPELRASRIGAVRLPRADGSRLRLTEFFQFILDLAIADSNLAHSLRNHYVAIENAILDPAPGSPRLLALAAEGLLFGGRGPGADRKLRQRAARDEGRAAGRGRVPGQLPPLLRHGQRVRRLPQPAGHPRRRPANRAHRVRPAGRRAPGRLGRLRAAPGPCWTPWSWCGAGRATTTTERRARFRTSRSSTR